MAKYGANNLLGGSQQNLSSSYKTLISLTAQTTGLRRAFISEWDIGLDGAPNSTDCAIDWDLSAITALGTGTAVTPNPNDQADAAATTVATVNDTAEPTYTSASSRWAIGANQRASYRWIAQNADDRIVVPAINVNGYGLRAKSATYASTAVAHMFFAE